MRVRNEEKVQLVKQKAMEMVVSDGFEGFSVNKLARACGISVATLYIYYKDKDDLITAIALEEAKRMGEITLGDFDPELSFAEGLRKQWENRSKYILENPVASAFFEQLRTSTYQDKVMECIICDFKAKMGTFMQKAIKNKEVDAMPLEVYWSVAYAPLYSLLRFHHEGRSLGGKPFVLNEDIMWRTFDLVVKALTPSR